MTTKLTRRTALLGTVTLPAALAPVAAMGNAPNSAHSAAEPDPALAAFARWQEARREEDAAHDAFNQAERTYGACSPEANEVEATVQGPAMDRTRDRVAEVAATIPTTLAGLVAQLTVAVTDSDAVFGAKHGVPEECLLVSMLIAAERFAGVSYGAHDLSDDDADALLRAWHQRRRDHDAAEARLAEVTEDGNAFIALRRMRYDGSMPREFIEVSACEGWSLDYVLDGKGEPFPAGRRAVSA